MKNTNEKGYAILFTVIIVSAISVITAGISNAIYKQIVLSSLAKDSQSAFYMADTASDCALLFDMEVADTNVDFLNGLPITWACGSNVDNSPMQMTVTPDVNSYDMMPSSEESTSNRPCYRVEVEKDTTDPLLTKTTILANGYNICNKNNIRTVERQIKIVYE